MGCCGEQRRGGGWGRHRGGIGGVPRGTGRCARRSGRRRAARGRCDGAVVRVDRIVRRAHRSRRRPARDRHRRVPPARGRTPGLPITWSGSLSWRAGESAPQLGPGQELVDAVTVAALEPAVRAAPEWAVWSPDDGAIDAIVVLAAAATTAELAAPLGVRIPVGPSPATLFRFRAPAGLVRTIVNTEDFDLRQISADRLIAAADEPERTLAAIRSTFLGADDVELLSATVGARPMPADGIPIIGPVAEVPGLYVTVMHPGVTLAAATGRLVAQELVDGTVEPLLAGCRPDRF